MSWLAMLLGCTSRPPDAAEPWPPPGHAVAARVLDSAPPHGPSAGSPDNNVFRGLFTAVPFEGTGTLMDTFDDDPREGHVMGHWPHSTPNDGSDAMRWTLQPGQWVVSPVDGVVASPGADAVHPHRSTRRAILTEGDAHERRGRTPPPAEWVALG